MKSKKWAHLESPNKKVIDQKWPVRSAKNGRSEAPDVAGQIGLDRQFRTTDHGRSNKDSAVQDKDRAVEAATAAAAVLLKRSLEKEWKSIGLAPTGSREFQETWESVYGETLGSGKLSDLMERCILACREAGISVPKPFFGAKRKVEKEEAPSQGTAGQFEYLPEMPPVPCKN
jgi:hypothetical protein